jgi:hypothetical protein
MNEEYFIGIDVGTGSVRAALVNPDGEILRIATHPIKTWNPKPGYYEQSSEDIWKSCSFVVKVSFLYIEYPVFKRKYIFFKFTKWHSHLDFMKTENIWRSYVVCTLEFGWIYYS